ncbi:hypothetical protein CY34DRAFT_210572 [Suillus luteus UH-Slu-Lm8-n1]|uniref:Uncharacterized protein n=1 Tax=Suillus luteus UH-Slu-Lm8-n1 TaxID=930992 RepID=A0A0D0ABF7_9AGAM|nr:hypothetical protein CY34DRAFT_210572 [Suillus luteus UH-Slu-Lm8-n1]
MLTWTRSKSSAKKAPSVYIISIVYSHDLRHWNACRRTTGLTHIQRTLSTHFLFLHSS